MKRLTTNLLRITIVGASLVGVSCFHVGYRGLTCTVMNDEALDSGDYRGWG